jgi:hypothetical protein
MEELDARLARPLSHPEPRTVDDAVLIACGLALGAGAIHVVACYQHVQEYLLYSVFFGLLAVGQIGLGVALYRSTRALWLWVGATTSLAVVALWVVSRTVGLPLGPETWTPEEVGPLDIVASADELVLALLMVLQLRPGDRPVAIACRRAAMGAGLFLFIMSALVLSGGHHSH